MTRTPAAAAFLDVVVALGSGSSTLPLLSQFAVFSSLVSVPISSDTPHDTRLMMQPSRRQIVRRQCLYIRLGPGSSPPGDPSPRRQSG